MLNELFQMLEQSLNNIYSLLFMLLFGVGWFLKEKTQTPNKYIPIILAVLGIILGLTILQLSIKGASAGFILSLLIMGFYDQIKPLIWAFLQKFIK